MGQHACHVPVVNTAWLVTHRAITLQLLVLLEPMPMGQQRVQHVPPVRAVLWVQLTVVRILQPLVL